MGFLTIPGGRMRLVFDFQSGANHIVNPGVLFLVIHSFFSDLHPVDSLIIQGSFTLIFLYVFLLLSVCVLMNCAADLLATFLLKRRLIVMGLSLGKQRGKKNRWFKSQLSPTRVEFAFISTEFELLLRIHHAFCVQTQLHFMGVCYRFTWRGWIVQQQLLKVNVQI